MGADSEEEEAGEAGETAEEALPMNEIPVVMLAAELIESEDTRVVVEVISDMPEPIEAEPMCILISRWTSGVEGPTSIVEGKPRPSGSF